MIAADIVVDEGMLMPISVETLRTSTALPFDLYVLGQAKCRPVLYGQRNHPLDQSDFQRLVGRGVRTLYIGQTDSAAYREYLRDTILANNDLSPVQRYQVLREATRAVLAEAFSKGDHDSAVTFTTDLSEGMVAAVCDSQVALNDILRVMSHDYGVFSHAVNVATNCLLLARHLGIADKQELFAIGQGGAAARHRRAGSTAAHYPEGGQIGRSRAADRAGAHHPWLQGTLPPRGPYVGAVNDGLQPSRTVRWPRVPRRTGSCGNSPLRPSLRNRRRVRCTLP